MDSHGHDEQEDVDMEAVSPTCPTLPTLGSGGHSPLVTASGGEQKAPRSEIANHFIRAHNAASPASANALSPLHQLAAIAVAAPLISESEESPATRGTVPGLGRERLTWTLSLSGPESEVGHPSVKSRSTQCHIVIFSIGQERGDSEEQKVIRIPEQAAPDSHYPINNPLICEIARNSSGPLGDFSASHSHSLPHNPILYAVLGDRDPTGTTIPLLAAQSINSASSTKRGEQRRSFTTFDLATQANTRTKGSTSLGCAPSPLLSPSATVPPLSLTLSLSQPSSSRRPSAIPVALSSPGSATRSPSLSLSSPRHSPYAHPSARSITSSSEALRSARIRLNNTAMLSPSFTYPSSATPPPRPSALPSTPPGQTSSSESTPAAPSPSSMSMSKRRRAPEWPSPRSYHSHAQSQSLSYPSHPLSTGQAPPSAFSRDLAQTIRTPAILRVPPTPDYSPAFHRSGFASHPQSAESDAPALVPLGDRSLSAEPLSRTHSPFSSAPPSSSSRLADPPSPPREPRTPISGAAAAAAKRQRVNLLGIPRGWVIEQLNERAGQYWHNPSSSDVRVLVPISRSRILQQVPVQFATTPTTHQNSAQSFHSNRPAHAVWPNPPAMPAGTGGDCDTGLLGHVKAGHTSANGRRGSLPGNDDVVALVFPLHQDYLITQSSLFRSLFAPSTPASHLDAPHTAPRSIKGARRLPTAPGAPPAILLPLPDPASFSVVVHWLYWGDISALESALSRGLVEWQGVVKNVHYLGMDDNVKRVLGKWWRKWIKTDEGRRRSAAGGSGMQGKQEWADSDEEEEVADEVDDEDENRSRVKGDLDMEGEPGWESRHTGSTRDEDDGGVAGLLSAL